jgi:adenylate cyclase
MKCPWILLVPGDPGGFGQNAPRLSGFGLLGADPTSVSKRPDILPTPSPQQIDGLEALRGWRRLHIRLTVLYGGVTLLALTLLALSVFLHGMRSEILAMQRRLLATVDSLASSIDAEVIAALPGEAKSWTPLHKALLRRFAEVAQGDGDVESIYLLKPTQEPTRLHFIVDYVKRGPSGKPGDIYDAANVPVMLQGFARPAVEDKPVTDAFGTTLSGYAPVQTRSGRSVAVVGVDVDASRLVEIRNGVLRRIAISFGFALLLLGTVATLIARNLRGPLTRIIEAATAISRGDLSTRVGLQRNDELGVMSQHLDLMAEQLQDREFIRETFGRYLSSKIATEVLNQRSGITLGGEERVVTVLFSDLRGYSSISEQMSPTQVVAMLNQYLGAMNEIIDRHRGCVIEFVGDAIFAVFGAPHYMADHAEQAMRCALAMRLRLKQLNVEWQESGMARRWQEIGVAEISMRIGVHTGQVVAGNLGSQTRMKYSVIGDTVNVASRLETLNKALGSEILISGDVYIQLPRDLMDAVIDCGSHKVKGREHPVKVYALTVAPATTGDDNDGSPRPVGRDDA